MSFYIQQLSEIRANFWECYNCPEFAYKPTLIWRVSLIETPTWGGILGKAVVVEELGGGQKQDILCPFPPS